MNDIQQDLVYIIITIAQYTQGTRKKTQEFRIWSETPIGGVLEFWTKSEIPGFFLTGSLNILGNSDNNIH